MAGSSIFADVSNYLIKLIQDHMCPDFLSGPEQIKLTASMGAEADYLVGLYLYDIKEDLEIMTPYLTRNEKQQLERPPRPYQLFYLIFLSDSALLNPGEAQSIVGRIAQVISDHAYVTYETLGVWSEEDKPAVVFSQMALGMEEKAGIWRALNRPYQMSLFYQAAPVFLASEVKEEIPIVTEAVLNFIENTEEGGERDG